MRERNEMVLADLDREPGRTEAGPRRPDLRAPEPRRRRDARRGAHLRGQLAGRTPTASRPALVAAGSGSARRPLRADDAQPPGVRGDHDRGLHHRHACSCPSIRARAARSSAYMLRNAGCRGACVRDYCLARLSPSAPSGIPDLGGCWRSETGEGERRRPDADAAGVDSLREVLAKPAPTVDVRLETPERSRSRSSTPREPPETRRASSSPTRASAAFAMLGFLAGYQPDERPYTGLSLTHGNAQAVTLGPSLSMGLRAVFSRRFTKSKLWDVCSRPRLHHLLAPGWHGPGRSRRAVRARWAPARRTARPCGGSRR